MTTTILTETPLPNLPSASGVEIVGPTAYVISDDSPFLYALEAATLEPRGQVQLFEYEADDVENGRIPKKKKPDVEAIAACHWPGRGAGLLLLGSGSKKKRHRGYWVPLSEAVDLAVALDLSTWYAAAAAALPADAKLNIEAAATTDTELLLLQRGVGAGASGWVLRWPLAAVLAHLADAAAPLPPAAALPVALPALEGWPAGFSGATWVGGRLLVAASVEITDDPVLDGQVLGSFVGEVNLSTGAATFTRLAWADGRPYAGKVEGLAERHRHPDGRLELLLVTDDDQGGSTALAVVLG